MGTGIRDLIAAISPTWLTSAWNDTASVASKLMFTLGLGQDLTIEKMQEGVQARMPTVGTATALPLIGADRNITRGFQETDDAYALRLKKAFDTWAHAGSAESVIWSVLSYVSPTLIQVRTVNDSGNWDTVPVGATSGTQPMHYLSVPNNWDWDCFQFANDGSRWWRSWVIIGTGVWSKNDPWGTAGRKWGDKKGTWGSTATSAQVGAVRSLVKTWKAAHVYVPWIIVSFDDTWFAARLPAGDAKLPDGYWGFWHKLSGGNAVPSRTANAIYWDGVL